MEFEYQANRLSEIPIFTLLPFIILYNIRNAMTHNVSRKTAAPTRNLANDLFHIRNAAG